MTDRFRFVALRRTSRYAIVRVMERGEVAGYDPAADVADEQRAFKIHRGPAAYDAAFQDSRTYPSLDAALAGAAEAGREVEVNV